MKKILVPTDFSECARVAEDYAMQLAKKVGAEIHFLHLLITPTNWVKLPLEKEKLYPETKAQIGNARDELTRLTQRAQKLGLKTEQFLTFDEGREKIDEHIKNHKHDFVVMGSRGRKGFKEIIGSNTQKVVRYSHVPVLVVKKKTRNLKVNNIVFASSFEEDVGRPFAKVMEFANIMKAKMHLLYVNTPFHFRETDEIESNMKAFLKKCRGRDCSINIYNARNEEKGIKKFTDKIKAEMIALTTHGRTGFMKIISSSITESLVNHLEIPILSINIKS